MALSWKPRLAATADAPLTGAHVAVFLMNIPGVIASARPLIETLRTAGCRVTVINYSCFAPFPYDELRDAEVTYLTLSDQGFDSIPRLTRAQYVELCGDDLDFARISCNESTWAGFRTERAWLFSDSFHWQRYYGTAWRIEQIIEALAPDYVVVNHGSEPVSRMVYAKARKRRLPALIWESAFFPNKILLDSRGMHFLPGESKIEHDWPQVAATALLPDEQTRLARFLADWRAGGISKYPQSTDESQWNALRAALDPHKKVLFIPGQVPWDANVLNGLHAFHSYAELLAGVRERLPDDWQIVYKPHPVTPTATDDSAAPAPGFHVVREASIHRLLELADAVLVHSSNVGLEALVYERPVIVCGRPYYAGRGLTLDLERPEELPALLERAVTFRTEPWLRDRLLNYVAFSYLIDEGDVEALVARLHDAEALAADAPGWPLAPFCAHLSFRAQFYAGLQRAYSDLAQRNLSHSEIMRHLADLGQLPWGAPYEAPEPLSACERSAGLRIGDLPAADVQAYQFTARLLPAGAHVLDLGCGTGYGSYLLAAAAGARVTAIDPGPSAIDYAQCHWSHQRVEYRCTSAGSFAAAAGALDAVVALGVLEYAADDRALVENLWAALAPGGRLIISVPSAQLDPLQAHHQRVRHYVPRDLEQLVKGLPGIAARRSLTQDMLDAGSRIREGHDGARLILVVEKASPRGPSRLADDLARLLPATELPPLEMTAPCHRFTAAEMTPAAAQRDELGGITFRGDPARGEEPLCLAFGPTMPLAAGTYELLFELASHHDRRDAAVTIRLNLDGPGRSRLDYSGNGLEQTPRGLRFSLTLDHPATLTPEIVTTACGPVQIIGWRIARVGDCQRPRVAA